MNSQIETFVYEGFDAARPVRVVMREGVPWFVAKDVCAILGIEQASRAVEPLDEDEKAGVSLTHLSSSDVVQNRETLIISESGLYTLILRSRQAVTKGSPAHKFRRWVTGELLPQIRKEGRFGDHDPTADWDWELIREKLALCREVRLAAGKKAALQLMADLGIPLPEEERKKQEKPTQGIDFVQQFMSECTEEYAGGRVQASALFKAYQDWAVKTDSPEMTQSAFGRTLSVLGFAKLHGRTYTYLGIRILHRSEMKS